MGEVLGLGLTHHPGLNGPDARLAAALRQTLKDPGLPDHLREPSGWPSEMRAEWGEDEGLSAAAEHRAAVVEQLRIVRQALDNFAPDIVVVWGDDQYENFREDIIPPFCVLAYDDLDVQPFRGRQMKPLGENVWGEAEDKVFRFRGHRPAAKQLTEHLLLHGFDMSYAYEPLHLKDGLPHPFVNTRLFLDYDRKGWDYAMIPIQVNCYGRRVIVQKGGLPTLSQQMSNEELDPPSPPPWRCFDLGAEIARFAQQSPWRVALIGSSSWSHAFLSPVTQYIHPDVEADRTLYGALEAGQYDAWRNRTLEEVEQSGQQEMLNWMCLVGAMAELGRKPDYTAKVETYIFNSTKAFAIFR
jgi:hypothetical protein